MFTEMSFRIFFFLMFVICLFVHDICSLNIKPLEFDANSLINVFESSEIYRKGGETTVLDPENSFTILKSLSLCNVKRKRLKTIAFIIFCKERAKDYDVEIKNVQVTYGQFVHSGNVKKISHIRLSCKYYLINNFYEIISCYDKEFSFGPFFFGFEISRSLKKNKNKNIRSKYDLNDYMHGNYFISENGEENIDTSPNASKSGYMPVDNTKGDGSKEIEVNKENSDSYCKLKILVNSYITTEEEKLLKILTGLCLMLGYEKQFFMSSNIYPIMTYYEQSVSNKLMELGYKLSIRTLYDSNVLYIIKGFNSFVSTNENILVNNIVPTTYLQFKIRESYLMWKGIERDEELFNKNLLKLKHLLNQIDFKSRIQLCYESSLINYYEDDEIYLSNVIKNLFRSTHFRNYNKNATTDAKENKSDEHDSFLTIFNNFCADSKVNSFEECIYRVITSTSLDEKSKSAFHQLMYDALLCLESCPPIENLEIFTKATVIKKLKEYMEHTKLLAFKNTHFSKEVEGKLKKKNNKAHVTAEEYNQKVFFPQDENIKIDFFENIMFFFEYHSISSLLKDELDKENDKSDIEHQICNIGKFLKAHGKVYLRQNEINSRKLEELDRWRELLTNSIGDIGFSSILKRMSDASNEEGLNLDMTGIKEKLQSFYALTKNDQTKTGEDNDEEDAEKYFFDDDELDDDEADEFEEVQRSKGKLLSNFEDADEENDDAEIDSLKKSHGGILSVLPLLLKVNNIVKSKEKKKKNLSYDNQENSKDSIKHSSFSMHFGNKEVRILEESYDYEILEEIFLEKKEKTKNDKYRRKQFFNYLRNNENYNFAVNDVPSKWGHLLQHENGTDKTKSKENNTEVTEEQKIDVTEKNTLQFICSMGTSWPVSKKGISFYRSNSVHCEAEYEPEPLIEMDEKKPLFLYLQEMHKTVREETKRTSAMRINGDQEGERNGDEEEEEEDKHEFFFVDKVLYSYNKIRVNNNIHNNKKEKDNIKEKITDSNGTMKMSKLIGFNLFSNICAIKYVGNNDMHINNSYLNHVLLKTVWGFCILHGFSILRVESEVTNTETGIKNKFLEILVNGKTEYEHLGLYLMNVAVFPKENYYITNGFLSNTNKNVLAYLKFQKNFYVEHNVENDFLRYMNKKSMELLHNLTFNCDRDNGMYLNCYEIYPLIRKGRDGMCRFEKNQTFIELNTLFPNDCKIGQKVRNCYKQIKKNIPCFKQSEGCKYYHFIVDTFIKPQNKYFFIEHKKNVNAYLFKHAYIHYSDLVQVIKNDEILYQHLNLKASEKNESEKNLKTGNKEGEGEGEGERERKGEGEEEGEGERKGEGEEEGEGEELKTELEDDDLDIYSENETKHITTDKEAYNLLNYLINNSIFFTFWNFSTEYWKRLRYIHDPSDSKSGIAFHFDTPANFCPAAYAYEFIYHLNAFYVWK